MYIACICAVTKYEYELLQVHIECVTVQLLNINMNCYNCTQSVLKHHGQHSAPSDLDNNDKNGSTNILHDSGHDNGDDTLLVAPAVSSSSPPLPRRQTSAASTGVCVTVILCVSFYMIL